MSNPLSQLRDDFANNTVDPVWGASGGSGSGTFSETGGQAVCALPSSTAGSHAALYRTSGTYDLTGDSFYWNIAAMVSTGVAATALLQLLSLDGLGQLYWRQVSGTLTARKTVAGVDTQLFTVTWNAATHKYLRIRESGGTIFFDSSTDGITWTNRASIVGLPFDITQLAVQFGVTGGNIASPGSLKLDDVNLILPALSSTWRWTQVEWPLLDRFRPITIAAEAGKQGYIAIASSIDSSGNLVSPVYYSGPMGSSSGGYSALTLAANQAAAQAMAVNLPLNGRWDLPTIVEARFIRLYHRSTDGASHKIFEYYPRRIVQTDDIEAESIRAINIAAGTITADKLFVLALSAITSNIGQLTLTNPTGAAAWLYQGTGTGDAPTTGLKIFNSGGIGKLSTYNAGIEQVTFDTDGKLKAGAGAVVLDATGIKIAAPTTPTLTNAYGFTAGGVAMGALYPWNTSGLNAMLLKVLALTSQDSTLQIVSDAPTGQLGKLEIFSSYLGGNLARITMQSNIIGGNIAVDGVTTFNNGVNVGTATGAGTGHVFASDLIRASGNTAPAAGSGVEIGYVNTSTGGIVLSYNRTGAAYTPLLIDASDISVRPSGSTKIRANGTGVGFFNATPIAKPTITGSRGSNAALASLLTALASYGLLIDSST